MQPGEDYTKMPVCKSWPMAVGIMIPNIGGMVSGYLSMDPKDPWYRSLNRPPWTPPNWVFGPAWTALYSAYGYSSYVVWRDGGGFEGAAVPLGIYGVSLALNYTWTPLFFGAHQIKLAFYEIIAVLGSAAATVFAFYKVNPVAAYMNIPLLAWTSFATVLNYKIYRMNLPAVTAGDESKEK